MPLHFTGIVTRRDMEHPEEAQGVRATPPLPQLELVLKYNKNHDKTGRFSSGPSGGSSSGGSSGGGGGATPKATPNPHRKYIGDRYRGSMGPPTSDAFGNPMGKAAETYRKMRAGEGGLGYTTSSATKPAGAKQFSVPASWPQGGRGRSAERAAAAATSAFNPEPKRQASNTAAYGTSDLAGGKYGPGTKTLERRESMFNDDVPIGGGTVNVKKPSTEAEYDRSTATATPGRLYDIEKAPPGGATRYKLVPAEPSHDRMGSDSSWVLDIGQAASKGIDPYKLNTKANKAIIDKKEKEIAKAKAKEVKSWDVAHRMANEAENENYHAVAAIFRSRAKAIRKGAK